MCYQVTSILGHHAIDHAVRHAVMPSGRHAVIMLCAKIVFRIVRTFAQMKLSLAPFPSTESNLTHVRTRARVWKSNCLYFSPLAYMPIYLQSHYAVYPLIKPLILFFWPLIYIVVDMLNYWPNLASWNIGETSSLQQSPSARYYRYVTFASKRQKKYVAVVILPLTYDTIWDHKRCWGQYDSTRLGRT